MAAAEQAGYAGQDEDRDRRDRLKKEAALRRAEAELQKSLARTDIDECYFFAAPDRASGTENSNVAIDRRTGRKFELQTSFGFEVADEFAGMAIDTFMPQSVKWAERRAPPGSSDAVKQSITQQAERGDETVFDLIRASDFYPALSQNAVPDAAIGLFAMHIHDEGAAKPIKCVAIPARELYINSGPDGRIDDRIWEKNTRYGKIPALLPGMALPAEISKRIADQPDKACSVSWAYWRDWSATDETWQHVVSVDGEIVHDAKLTGEGSCMMVVGRFGSSPDFAWPSGPLVKSLPDLRQLDEMRGAFVENHDFTLRPPVAYPDDGVMNVTGGIEAGMAYPKRPGTKGEIEEIYTPHPLDAALFDATQLERRIKRLHYVDFPEQPGKTPPTATQWVDELVKSQKRIGTPGYSFWREFPCEVFKRFLYLAEKRGIVDPIEVNGARATLQAYNPAQRAQESQEVLNATRLIQIGESAFPQVWQAAVDPLPTLVAIQEKLGDKLVSIRSPEQLKKGLSDLAQVAGVRGNPPSGGLVASQPGPVT